MASRVVSSTENSATASSTAQVVTPVGTAINDVVLAILYLEGGSGTTVTPPAGWTSELRTDDSTTRGIEMFSRVMTSISATYDFTLSAGVDWWTHAILLRGEDILDAVDGAAGVANASDTSFPAPSIPVQTDDTVIVGAWMGAAANIITAPSTMTALQEDHAAGSAVLSAYEIVKAGQSGARVATVASATTSVGCLIGVNNSRRVAGWTVTMVMPTASTLTLAVA